MSSVGMRIRRRTHDQRVYTTRYTITIVVCWHDVGHQIVLNGAETVKFCAIDSNVMCRENYFKRIVCLKKSKFISKNVKLNKKEKNLYFL